MSAPNRTDLLRQSTSLVGIDFVRVSKDQRELSVFLHHKTPMPVGLFNSLSAIKPEQIKITPESTRLPRVIVQDGISVGLEHARRFLRIPILQPGGFGYYRLLINHPAFDPFSKELTFSFKAGCPTDLDCASETISSSLEEDADFPVDYRARDFHSFRQALTDFASQRYPNWQDRLEADLGTVLVDMLSAMGDEFAYAQDRIAREVHFGTATQRRSLRHLARLVDYHPDDGSGATTWLDFSVNNAGALPALTAVSDVHGKVVFELGHGLQDKGKAFGVSPQRNTFTPYQWDENQTCLPAGSTSIHVFGHWASHFLPDDDIDTKGKWILITNRPSAPDIPERRLMVRVLSKDGAVNMVDPLSGPTNITRIQWEQPTPFDLDLTTLELHGNLLPATSGKTQETEFWIRPGASGAPEAMERVGPNGCLSYDTSLEDEMSPRVKFLFSLPGSDATPLVWLPNPKDPGTRRPEITLVQQGDGSKDESWTWLHSLVGEIKAPPTSKLFTLEDGMYATVFGVDRLGKRFEFRDYASNSGTTLRFGDGEFGMAPKAGSHFKVQYRLGNGSLMNVAPQTLTKIPKKISDPTLSCIDTVTNPMAAQGGTNPESSDSIRTNAPEAFRAKTYRAVRPEDFEEIAQRELPWVQRAGAAIRWTGSWPTVFVTPDPLETTELQPNLKTGLERLVERVRQAGREAKVTDPNYVSLDLEIHLCAAPSAYASEVEKNVISALFDDGDVKGFFHPDHFTFGTALSRAALLACIQNVPGVCSVREIRVRWRGRFDWKRFEDFQLTVGQNEILQVTNNSLLRDRGAVTLVVEGGA